MLFASLKGDPAALLDQAAPMVGASDVGRAGVDGLGALFEAVAAAGADPARFALDPSIARGLDYYTRRSTRRSSTICRASTTASGGRYDDLAGLYTKQHLPGVGASLGVDRLLAAMEGSGSPTGPRRLPGLPAHARRGQGAVPGLCELRRAGVGVELYPEARKLGAQLKYADRRGFRFAVIAGGREFDAGTVQLKDLASKESREMPREDVAAAVNAARG